MLLYRVNIYNVLFHIRFPEQFLDMGLNLEEETIAGLLKEKSYTTAMVEKWHLGDWIEFLLVEQGFDKYFGILYLNNMNRGNFPLIKNNKVFQIRPFFYYLGKNIVGVMVGDWKYIDEHNAWWILNKPGKDGVNGKYRNGMIPTSLFNLTNDVQGSQNLIDEKYEKAKKLSAILESFSIEIAKENRPYEFIRNSKERPFNKYIN